MDEAVHVPELAYEIHVPAVKLAFAIPAMARPQSPVALRQSSSAGLLASIPRLLKHFNVNVSAKEHAPQVQPPSTHLHH